MWQKESNYQYKLVNQMFLFSNLYLSLLWGVSCIWVMYKVSAEQETFTLHFPLICFCIGVPVEALRIYLGYSGDITNNMAGSSPSMAGFSILTTFITFPVNIYMFISLFESLHHVHFAIQITQLTIQPIEMLLSFVIIKNSLHEKNLEFQMMYHHENKKYQ